jgi:hypothetical protein
MAVEWWILACVVLAVSGVAAVTHLRKPRRANPEETKNIYPLW